jgi:hypothetical protein
MEEFDNSSNDHSNGDDLFYKPLLYAAGVVVTLVSVGSYFKNDIAVLIHNLQLTKVPLPRVSDAFSIFISLLSFLFAAYTFAADRKILKKKKKKNKKKKRVGGGINGSNRSRI